MIILLHSSKTMRPPATNTTGAAKPQLLAQAAKLACYLKTLNPAEIKQAMTVSDALAGKTQALIAGWTDEPSQQRPAIDSFLGDIYSGLQVPTWSAADRDHAQNTLRILSGLYGILRPLDGIYPYRLEMGYRLPAEPYQNLYQFWGENIAQTLPAAGPIINLAAVEYSKTITPFVAPERVITPVFQTISPKTGQPTFVVVHAKIARGALAAWLIRNRISDTSDLKQFNELGYSYRADLSTPESPTFVCEQFGGLGLSVRLT